VRLKPHLKRGQRVQSTPPYNLFGGGRQRFFGKWISLEVSMKKLLWVFVFFTFLFLIRTFAFQIVWISGNSMLPALKNQAVILVNKIGFTQKLPFTNIHLSYHRLTIRRKEIVLIEADSSIIIKRVVGVPGDVYQFESGQLFINQSNWTEQFALYPNSTEKPNEQAGFFPQFPFRVIFSAGEVPEGYFLVLGDNRKNSTDSRSLGLVHHSIIRGKLQFILKK
jgi:signal peptidase I